MTMIARSILALVLTFQICGRAGANDVDFAFPASRSASHSPAGNYWAGYRDTHTTADGIHEYEFSITDRAGRTFGNFIFTRSVEGAWAPGGLDIFVNNFIGSNLADCLISRRSQSTLLLESMIGLLTRGGAGRNAMSRLGITESPENSHYALTCSRWLDNETIEVAIQGYVDTEVDFGREFDYRLRYSLNTGNFERIGAP